MRFSPSRLSYWFHGILICVKLNQQIDAMASRECPLKPNSSWEKILSIEMNSKGNVAESSENLYWNRGERKKFFYFDSTSQTHFLSASIAGIKRVFKLPSLTSSVNPTAENTIHCCVLLLILMNLYLLCSLITTAVILSFNNPENIFNHDREPRKRTSVLGRKIKLQFKQRRFSDQT